MKQMELKKAVRKQVKLRLGMSGASGFGKTYSALLLAYGMTNDWSKIAVIDTENKSASLYANLGEYNTLELSAPYSPERYTEAIKTCENAGMEVIIIDSISHEWEGKGGCLEIVESYGGRYQDWAKVTPRHNAFIQTILQSNCHIITTVRRKQDYDMIKNEHGKTTVQKVGMKEVTREGFEYEITINFEFLNDNHMVKASKDRTSLFCNQPEFVITTETGKKIKEWCECGIVDIVLTEEEKLNAAILDIESCQTEKDLKETWSKHKIYQKNESFIEAKNIKKNVLIPEIITIEDLQLLFDMKKESIPSDNVENIQRIIDNNEITSFKKVKDYLTAL